MNYEQFKDEYSSTQEDIYKKMIQIIASQKIELEQMRDSYNLYKRMYNSCDTDYEKLRDLKDNHKQALKVISYVITESYPTVSDDWKGEYDRIEKYLERMINGKLVDCDTKTGEFEDDTI